ncbi:phage tail protein [Romboutsia sp. 1001713B170131_170501_G6]|uniref:phage tail protein n=1 Tax=Romboutsia sp. 1001713B170131_170501_G6 TaxID=2787108 RepID=UPI0018AA61A3|nr:phage tail protein [Romboutsia sp. 1001713B170131_170501_G6]
MNEQFYTILTKIGKAKIANATALGTQLNIVKFHVGDGNGSYYNPTEEQTQLKNKLWEGNISSIRIDDENPNWVILEAVIPGSDGGFMVREVGAVDSDGNLIAIGKFPETYKPIAGDGSVKDLILKMVLEISNTSSVTLKIDPTVILATKKDILDLEEKINNIELVDTKVKLTDLGNLFELGEDANINQALIKLFNKSNQIEEDLNGQRLKAITIHNKLDKCL